MPWSSHETCTDSLGVDLTHRHPETEVIGFQMSLFAEVVSANDLLAGEYGTPLAPDLSHSGARSSKAYRRRWLTGPAAQRPAAHVRKRELSEIEALADSLASRT
jgi:hypothetical protein